MFVHKLIFVCIVVCIICYVNSQQFFGCETEYCSKIVGKCPELKCENGTILQNATKCGCCDICVASLGEGENCQTQLVAGIPREECGPQLICSQTEKKCVSVKTSCVKDRAEHKDKGLSKDIPFGFTKPKCDRYGYYEPLVCLSDILCYCVNKDGKRIFGTEIASKVNSTQCNCSREFEEFPRSVADGDFLRCLPNGNYDELQCTEEWCYCMQDTHPDLIDVEIANTTLKSLRCYEENLHGKFDALLLSKCWQERKKLKELIKNYQTENIIVIGVDIPQCDLDGSYAPVQCKKDSCYCVNKEGRPFEGHRVPRNSKEAEDMDCSCVRDKHLINQQVNKNENMKLFVRKYECASNGNYKD